MAVVSPAGDALLTRYSVIVLAKNGLCLAIRGCKVLAINCFNMSGRRVLTWSISMLPTPPQVLIPSSVVAVVDVVDVVAVAVLVLVVEVVEDGSTGVGVTTGVVPAPAPVPLPLDKVAIISFRDAPIDDDMVFRPSSFNPLTTIPAPPLIPPPLSTPNDDVSDVTAVVDNRDAAAAVLLVEVAGV